MLFHHEKFIQLSYHILNARCILCEEITTNHFDLCKTCQENFPTSEFNCDKCGTQISPQETNTTKKIYCGACLKTPPYFDKIDAPWIYEREIKYLIQQLKFCDKPQMAYVLSQCFCQFIIKRYTKTALPTCLIPVPLHRSRLCERGFNQAIEIGQFIANTLSIPLDKSSLIREKPTKPQFELSLQHRKNNVRHAFRLTKKMTSEHIAIIDDIVTTGSTVNEISRLLKSQHVKKISVWCLARA